MSLLQWDYATWTSLPDDGDVAQVNLTTQRVLRSRQPPSRGQKMSERAPAWEGLNDCDSFEDEAPKQNTDELLSIRPTTKGQKRNGCLSMTSARNYILPKLGIVKRSPAAGGNSQPRSCNLVFGDPEQTAQLCRPRPLTFRNMRLLKMDF